MREKYLFGPVLSRRLGLSLGVDIVPFKVCTLDCVYCQLAKTSEKTIERKDYCSVGAVLDELKKRLAQGLQADFITVSGSGEPTLNVKLGHIIEGIKGITDIPVAVLTNGTLLTDKSVRADCARADVVLPSLDAGDEQTFQKINRPHFRLSIEKLIAGLCAFRNEFAGELALEVFLLEGFNTDTKQIGKIKDAIERIRPDKIQLNTAMRPTAEPDVKRLDAEKLRAIAKELGQKCEVVSSSCVVRVPSCVKHNTQYAVRNTLLSMLKRRPCSLNDICMGLGLGRDEALKYITHFQQQGLVHSKEKDGIVFFRAN